MATIKGQNLRVMVNGKCVAQATNMTLHIATQMEDESTKDSTGSWQEQTPVGLSWDASTDALVSPEGSDSTGVLLKEMLDLQLGMTKVQLTFDQTSGEMNRTASNNQALKRTGYAYIADAQVTAQNRQNSALTVQFTGTGPLT